ncbi:MAG: autotransporter outer membrane beta-barrel domain-containing protein [Rickettsiaceae bacterium]
MQELKNNLDKYLTAEEQALGNTLAPLGVGIYDNTSHATAPVNNIKRQLLFSVITAPSRVAMVREVPLQLGMKTAQRNLLMAQNFSNNGTMEDNASPKDGQHERRFAVQLYGDVNQSHTGHFSNKNLGFKADNAFDAGLGVNYKATDNFMVGARVDFAESKIKFSANQGDAKINEQAVSLHGVYSFDTPVFIYASGGVGKIDYKINRDIDLGLATHRETGKTTGTHIFSTLGTGYKFDIANNASLTPFVAGHYQSVSMKDYRERSSGGDKTSTEMGFSIPNRKSVMAEVGLTLASNFAVKENVQLIPSLTVSYLYDWKDPLTTAVKGRNLRDVNYFKVPAYKVQKQNMQIQGDISTNINNRYKIGINASARPTGRVKSWSIGLKSSIQL